VSICANHFFLASSHDVDDEDSGDSTGKPGGGSSPAETAEQQVLNVPLILVQRGALRAGQLTEPTPKAAPLPPIRLVSDVRVPRLTRISTGRERLMGGKDATR
jgi:hypothetical protein